MDLVSCAAQNTRMRGRISLTLTRTYLLHLVPESSETLHKSLLDSVMGYVHANLGPYCLDRF